jgi:hypothetical protein
MENVLYAMLQTMFEFLLNSIHACMDFVCDHNNKVTNEIY